MRISFVGSGKVATHLAKTFSSQHQIVQIMSRNRTRKKLANQVGAQAINDDQTI
jgi:Trk K+ transport system NAD-binding subunit